MKRRSLIAMTTLLLTLGLVGCGGEPKTKECEEHTFELVNDGEKHHNKCTVCGVEEEAKDHSFKKDASKSVEATCAAEGKTFKACACGATKEETVAKLTTHKYVEDTTKSKAADCKNAGEKVSVCSVCQDKKVEAIPATGAHNFSNKQEVKVDNKVSYSTATCTGCQKKVLAVNALNWKNISGSNKDSSNATLKLSSNGDYTEYEFNAPAAVANAEVALYGWIDYWKDGSNNNDQRTFFSGKSSDGSTANIDVEVNGTKLTITNKQTFEEMGMTAGSDGNGTFTICLLGATTNLVAGKNTIKYTRTESYNLNITDFYFIY